MTMRLLSNKGRLDDATWADVEAVLPELKVESFFRLTIMPVPETGPDALEVQAENGNYRPVMANKGGGGYRFSDPAGREKDMVEICGYDYDAMGVTQDYDLIVRMVKEFYHTGNVSPELWVPQPNKSE